MQGLEKRLAEFVGQEAEPPRVARYPVSAAMIRNWGETHDDNNPVYVDAEAARATGRADAICPPAMISTWAMSGYRRYREVQRLRSEGVTEDFAYSRLLALLDEAGFTSVVATNVEQEHFVELSPNDHATAFFTIEAIAPFQEDRSRFRVLHHSSEEVCGPKRPHASRRTVPHPPVQAHHAGG